MAQNATSVWRYMHFLVGGKTAVILAVVMSANIAKIAKQGFFLLAENTYDKYRKNRNSIKDFSCELKTPVTNIAKIAKVTRIFLAS